MNKWLAGLVAGVMVSGAAQAALIDRGGGMLFDTVLNVTWLQDANYAKTSGYDADGMMTWSQATTWANNLAYGGYSDWRLASNTSVGAAWNYNYATNGSTDVGYNITSTHSEFSYMYYVNLGLHGYFTLGGAYDPTWGIFGNGTSGAQANVGLVHNLQSYYYWSGTEYALNSASDAWFFKTYDGVQTTHSKGMPFYAWAVRPGDVAAGAPAAVPEPATLALALAGLGLAGLANRRRPFNAS